MTYFTGMCLKCTKQMLVALSLKYFGRQDYIFSEFEYNTTRYVVLAEKFMCRYRHMTFFADKKLVS